MGDGDWGKGVATWVLILGGLVASLEAGRCSLES